MSRLDVLLTNDSGLMHLAAAVGAPLVALFGPTDPRQTGPRGQRQKILQAEAECAPCFKRACPLQPGCLERISVDRVVAAARDLLR